MRPAPTRRLLTPTQRLKLYSAADVNRFWRCVNIRGPDDCWEWTKHRNRDGYGQISIQKKHEVASRVSYQILYGRISKDKIILHTCDNPPCVNPNHLWAGTHADNMRDMSRKGRAAGGRHQRLKKDVAFAIYKSTLPYHQLAAMYGTTRPTVLRVKQKRRWRHLNLFKRFGPPGHPRDHKRAEEQCLESMAHVLRRLKSPPKSSPRRRLWY